VRCDQREGLTPKNTMDGNGNIEAIALLQKWFIDRCNGDWEHSWGITIETLDNPGWIIKINLQDTVRAYEDLDQVKIQRGENDWVMYKVENAQFVGSCGPLNLGETIGIFLNWFESARI
jgi:hypothetical protein